jgi:glucokinase
VSARRAIGVDVGGTKTEALRVTDAGQIEARSRLPTPAKDQAATLGTIEQVVEDVLTDDVVAVGMGAAGLVDVSTGVLLAAPNIAWRNVPLRERIAGRFDRPVTVDNDATAAAWAEHLLGAGRGYRHLLFVGVGTGIGGGIVIDGRLTRGAHGLAGEIGHIIVEPGGPVCGCGNRGCWEQVAGGHALARAGARAVLDDPESEIAKLARGDPARATGELVARAAAAGDGAAVAIVAEVGHRLGEGIAGLVNVLDPEAVVVGGGVSELGAPLLDPIRERFLEAVEFADVRPEVTIVAAALGNDAGAIGAAMLALEAAGA